MTSSVPGRRRRQGILTQHDDDGGGVGNEAGEPRPAATAEAAPGRDSGAASEAAAEKAAEKVTAAAKGEAEAARGELWAAAERVRLNRRLGEGGVRLLGDAMARQVVCLQCVSER
jgi:hypothetical protein